MPELPFKISNEAAVLISLLGPFVLRWIWQKITDTSNSIRELPITRAFIEWRRSKRYRQLLLLRRLRHIPSELQERIVRAYTYQLLFWLCVVFYIYLLIGSPIKEAFNINDWLTVFLTMPLYITEIKWLNARAKKNELLAVVRGRRV